MVILCRLLLHRYLSRGSLHVLFGAILHGSQCRLCRGLCNILHGAFRSRFRVTLRVGLRGWRRRLGGDTWPILRRQLDRRAEAVVDGVAQLRRVRGRLARREPLGQLPEKCAAVAAVDRAAPAQVDDGGVVAPHGGVNVLARRILVLHSIARWRPQHAHQARTQAQQPRHRTELGRGITAEIITRDAQQL